MNVSTITAADLRFIKRLASQIAMKHARRAMRVPAARDELATDIAEAIAVCTDTKVLATHRRTR
jgi:hypothetical protein